MEFLLDFLGSNSEVLTAIGAIIESIVVLVNLLRKHKNKKNKRGAGVMSAPPSFTRTRSFLWIINPINCFRKVK